MASPGVCVSVRGMCNHRVVVYRATVARNEFGDTVETWRALVAPYGYNAFPNQAWSGDLQDPGPGSIQAMSRQWFLVTGFDVQERDVLRVVSGPTAPGSFRVVSVTRPTAGQGPVNHLEVNVEPWTGTL